MSCSHSDRPTSACPARRGTCWPCRRRSPACRPVARGCRAGRAWSTPSPRRPRRGRGAPASPSAASSASSSACISRPAQAWQQPRQRLGRGMGAMRGRKGIVAIDIAQRRQRGGKARVVGFLAGVKARVLQQRDAARAKRSTRARRGRPDAIGGEAHVHAEHRFQRRDQHGQAHLGHRSPFGRPKCASSTGLPPLGEDVRRGGLMRSIRVVSVTAPSAIGTLMSTRVSTRLPAGPCRPASSRSSSCSPPSARLQVSAPAPASTSMARLPDRPSRVGPVLLRATRDARAGSGAGPFRSARWR